MMKRGPKPKEIPLTFKGKNFWLPAKYAFEYTSEDLIPLIQEIAKHNKGIAPPIREIHRLSDILYRIRMPYPDLIRAANLPRRPRPDNKVTLEEARKMREAYATGKESYRSIAAKYKISFQAVHMIVDNKLYHDPTYEVPLKRPQGRPRCQ